MSVRVTAPVSLVNATKNNVYLAASCFASAIQLFDLLDEHLLIRVLGENQHYRMAAHVTQPAHFAVHAAPKKFRSRTRNRGNAEEQFSISASELQRQLTENRIRRQKDKSRGDSYLHNVDLFVFRVSVDLFHVFVRQFLDLFL